MPTVSTSDGLTTNIGASQVTEPVDVGPVSGKVSSPTAYGYPPRVQEGGLPTTANPAGAYW